MVRTSVADPNVFGPPGSGSGSISQRYGSGSGFGSSSGSGFGSGSGSGSGSFYYHAKIVRKTLIPTIFVTFFNFLSLKNDVNVPPKSNKQKILVLKFISCWHLEDQ
jgi:hypothetical protein